MSQFDPATHIRKFTSTSSIGNFAKAGGIGIVGGQLYVNLSGSVVRLADYLSGVSPTTTLNIGAKNGSTVSAVEYGDAFYHNTVLTLTALPLTLLESDGANGLGVKIYDFPLGSITILSAFASIAETTTGVLANTLNTAKVLNIGVGTVTQSHAVLATTEQDILTVGNVTSSTTTAVAGPTTTLIRTGAPATFNGTATAIDAFFNVGVAVDDDIDDPATTTYTGTITMTWLFNGVI